MALGLAHNGTRPGGMTRAHHRNARDWRRAVEQDTHNREMKVQSMRMARRAARIAIVDEVAETLAERRGLVADEVAIWDQCAECFEAARFNRYAASWLRQCRREHRPSFVNWRACLAHDTWPGVPRAEADGLVRPSVLYSDEDYQSERARELASGLSLVRAQPTLLVGYSLAA